MTHANNDILGVTKIYDACIVIQNSLFWANHISDRMRIRSHLRIRHGSIRTFCSIQCVEHTGKANTVSRNSSCTEWDLDVIRSCLTFMEIGHKYAFIKSRKSLEFNMQCLI